MTCGGLLQPCCMEMGFNSDWIEKGLAHEERSSRGVYNKAAFEMQRRHMARQWSDAVEAWKQGRSFSPALAPPETGAPRFSPAFLALT